MVILFLLLSMASAIEHHLYWNSSNPIWKEPDPVLHVRLGDRIRIYCPDLYQDQRTSHLKVFQVSEFSYAECMLETGKQQVVLCNGNEGGRPRSTIITVRPYSSTPNALTFSVGQYYWISTSNGRIEGLDRTMYGLCKSHQMRLKINVSERLAERQATVKTTETPRALPPTSFETPKIPDDFSVNEKQLQAVIELASKGKTGTYKHNDIEIKPSSIEDAQPWNPLETNYYKNYYKQDPPLYEPIDSKSVKDYEIGEDLAMGRSYPSYLSSSSKYFLSFFLVLIFFL